MLASKLAGSIPTLRALWNVDRFDKGMEIKSRKEFCAGTAPTRKGSARRTTEAEKYIQRVEKVTRIGTRQGQGKTMTLCEDITFPIN
jgi:hypothetical protein